MGNALIIASNSLPLAEQAFTQAASATMRAALPAPPSSTQASFAPQPAAQTTITQPLDMASGIVAQMQPEVRFKVNPALHRTANDLYRALLKATAP